MTVTAEMVLDEVNVRHRTSWRLLGRLSGGYQWLDLVLPVVARQAGLGRDGMRNWSAYDHDVVYATGNANRSAVASSGSAGAQLVAVITRLNRGHEDVRLPDQDLVHGDLNPENVLIADGTVAGLVDVEAVGRGSRLHDLTTLLLYATLWGDQEEVRSRLIAECRTIDDRGWLEITLGAVTVDLLAFGVQNWPSDDLAAACRTAAALLSGLCPDHPSSCPPSPEAHRIER